MVVAVVVVVVVGKWGEMGIGTIILDDRKRKGGVFLKFSVLAFCPLRSKLRQSNCSVRNPWLPRPGSAVFCFVFCFCF